MIVSWNWLKEYVALDASADEFAQRLTMAGLNHESTEPVGNDLAIDLEVTSNRSDCLGHLGIAREAAVLFDRPLRLPAASPREAGAAAATLTKVELNCPDLCPRYTARVLRGVKVKASPAWLVNRLATLGLAAINNVVDITNYVSMECGQPLHAFDLARLLERRIVVREARAGEKLQAIDHREYELAPGMCVIADASRPVAIAGVMGGAATEVTGATTEILLEAAEFEPRSVRATARKLGLHSDSSYRFERGVDPHGVDWASRRACETILELAGGELAAGAIAVGREPPPRQAITLRLSQLRRVLGIEVPLDRVRAILAALGNRESSADASRVEVIPPTWRADLSREIDLIEEVARVNGYEAIPEDVRVPMAVSGKRDVDRVAERVRQAMTAAGFDEAITVSVVEQDWSDAFSPWTSGPPLACQTPLLRRADRLRRSLVPSLLGARRTNETLGNPTIELFETARVYLPAAPGEDDLPREEPMLALCSGRDFFAVKGVLEAVVANLNPRARVEARLATCGLLDVNRRCELWLEGSLWGFLGAVDAAGKQRFDLRGPATVAEVRLADLLRIARLTPQYVKQSPFPAATRDLNFVVGEALRWSELAETVRAAAGPALESIEFKELYRDEQRLGPGKKSLLVSLTLRSAEGTLTTAQADTATQAAIDACREKHAAELRA